MTTKLDVDYLDEDPVIPNQQFYILSYLLPEQNEKGTPMIKVRGVFRDQESCQKRVKILQDMDVYFDIIVAELGKWSPLLTKDELLSSDIDVEYREAHLQNIMKSYKENQDKSNDLFEKRKQDMKKKAETEGSKEGQLKLQEQKEEPVVIIDRIKTYDDLIKELEERMTEVRSKKDEDVKLLSTFTQDEVKDSISRFEEYQKQNKEIK